jgi:aldose 1-epimerase
LDGGKDVLGHKLMVRANLRAPVDADHVPDGTLAGVAGTGYDFCTLRGLHADVGGSRTPLDTTYLLRRDVAEKLKHGPAAMAHAATLVGSSSALALECWTTEPALQVYDGHKLAVAVPGLHGTPYAACAGIALEPQHVPDSPNLPHFPSTILRPGAVYRQRTEYRFRPTTTEEM